MEQLASAGCKVEIPKTVKIRVILYVALGQKMATFFSNEEEEMVKNVSCFIYLFPVKQ